MPFVNTDGNILHYRIDGDDGLPLLVLSNGLGTDLSMWDLQVTALSRRFRVLRYDTRGHGASSTSPESFAIDHLGRDVLALLDGVGVARVHFCGLSLGGMIGMWLGIHAPDRLNGLVLAHTAACIGPQAMWNERIDTVNSKGMTAISDAAITRWFTADFIASQPATVGVLKAAMERTSAEGYVRCCEVVRDTDHRETVNGIKAPTLIISGALDIATPPADGRFLAQRIAGAQSIEFEAAHLSNIESSRQFNDALLAFCSSTNASIRSPQNAPSR